MVLERDTDLSEINLVAAAASHCLLQLPAEFTNCFFFYEIKIYVSMGDVCGFEALLWKLVMLIIQVIV